MPSVAGGWDLARAAPTRRWAPWLLAFFIGWGAGRHVLALPPLWGVAPLLAQGCFLVSALAFIGSLLVDAIEVDAWPRVSWAPLVTLTPLCLPPSWLSATQLVIVGIAAIALAEWSRETRAEGELAVVIATHAFALGVAITLVRLAWDRHGHLDNDPAYYAGVARHIATTGRWEEQVVWHFQA